MKIAILHSALTVSGGAERVVIREAQALAARGHEVTCFAAAVDRRRCFPDEIGGLRVEPYLASLSLPRLDYLAAVSTTLLLAPLIVRRLRPYEALIAHQAPAPWLAYEAAQRYEMPYLCYLHHPSPFLRSPRLAWLDRRALQGADLVLAGGEPAARAVARCGVQPLVCAGEPGPDGSGWERHARQLEAALYACRYGLGRGFAG